MRSLRILVNNIELDHVREDAKIRNENSSFTDSLKLQHTTRPIRIVENQAAVDALGEFSLQTAKKKKYFPCKVVMGAVWYNGILTQNEKISGFRKCDLKFGSEVNEIMDQKVASYFPEFNVTGAAIYPEYSDESAAAHNAGQAWKDHANSLKGKTFPEVKWQLPQMSWRGKFGHDLKQEDTHYRFLNHINYYMLGELLINRPGNLADTIDPRPYNANVIAPQVYLLSPLYYAFQSIGYVLSGSFVRDPFFKRMLLLSTNDNMTLVIQKYPGVALDFNTPPWQQVFTWNILGLQTPTYAKTVKFTADKEGEFKIRYSMRMAADFGSGYLKGEYGLDVFLNGALVGSFSSMAADLQEGDLPITIEAANVGQEIEVHFNSFSRELPAEYLIEYAEDLPDLEFHDVHPTIDFSRYLPDWTVAAYLNNIKNTFNLKIDIDDVAREVKIEFNEADYLIGGKILPVNKSLQVLPIGNIPTESYTLRYANDSDQQRFISIDPLVTEDGNTTILKSEFKYIPHTRTAALSDAVADKEGVGLMLSAPGTLFTTETYQGRSLTIGGEYGIFNMFWRRWILLRLNGSPATLKGPFTQTELFLINHRKKIYIDHQLWLVKSVDYKENPTGMYEAEIEVVSVTF